MRFPSKVTAFNDSIIAKFPIIFKELDHENLSPNDLYIKIQNKINGITEFVEIMICLYALNKIEIIEGDVLHYVKKY